MSSQIIFSFKDLLFFILWGCLVGVFIYIILILRRALLVMREVNLLIKKHRTEIDATLEVVPDLVKNVETITGEVAHDVKAFRGTVENIAETTEAVTETIKENKGIVSSVSSIIHTFSLVKVFYDKFVGGEESEEDLNASSVQNTASKVPE